MPAGTQNAVGFVGYPKQEPGASLAHIYLNVTIPATGQDTADDRVNLLAFPSNFDLVGIDLLGNDALDAHATPTLDADLFIVTGCTYPDDAGTEAQVYNAGTRWQTASTTRLWIPYSTATAASAINGMAYLRWKVVTGVGTAAAGAIKMIVYLKSR